MASNPRRATRRPGWSTIDLTPEPRLLAGWRTSHKRLEAQRFRLHEDVFGDLRGICAHALSNLNTWVERPYEPFAAAETNEFFAIDIGDLPTHPPIHPAPTATPGSIAGDLADLVRLVRNVDGLDMIPRADIDEGGYSFYAICFPQASNGMVGFVTKSDPFVVLRTGLRYYKYGDTLVSSERPDVALKPSVDLVVGADRLAILRMSAFTTLLGDTKVAFQAVGDDLIAMQAPLQPNVPLSVQALGSLALKAGNNLSFARRVRVLRDRLSELTNVTAGQIRASMQRHGVDPTRLLDPNDRFSFDTDEVGLFLDLLEGRFFEDDLSGERRRADRFSRR